MPPKRRIACELPPTPEICSAPSLTCNPRPRPSPSPKRASNNTIGRTRKGILGFGRSKRGWKRFARHSAKVSALQSSRKREEAEKPRVLGRGGRGVEGGGGGGGDLKKKLETAELKVRTSEEVLRKNKQLTLQKVRSAWHIILKILMY